jgi:hypothetical protein
MQTKQTRHFKTGYPRGFLPVEWNDISLEFFNTQTRLRKITMLQDYMGSVYSFAKSIHPTTTFIANFTVGAYCNTPLRTPKINTVHDYFVRIFFESACG